MVSIDPDDLDRAFDLIDALESSDEYSGGSEVTSLYGYPDLLDLSLRRALSRSSSHHARGAAMSCLIDYGVRQFYSSEIVKRFIEQFSTLDKNDDLDASTIEHLELWRKQIRFSLTAPTNILGLRKRYAFKSTEAVHNKLSGLAGQLGISLSVLGAVCVMVGLEGQPGVLPEHASAMRAEVERFDRLLADRERQLSTLLRLAEEGVWL